MAKVHFTLRSSDTDDDNISIEMTGGIRSRATEYKDKPLSEASISARTGKVAENRIATDNLTRFSLVILRLLHFTIRVIAMKIMDSIITAATNSFIFTDLIRIIAGNC